jgi:hypothetical protein
MPRKRKTKGSGPDELKDGDLVILTFELPNEPFTIKKIDHMPSSIENNKVYTIEYNDNITQNSLWIYRNIIKSIQLPDHKNQKISQGLLRVNAKDTSPTKNEITKPRTYRSHLAHKIRSVNQDIVNARSRKSAQTIYNSKFTSLQHIPEKKILSEEFYEHYFEVFDNNNRDSQYLKINDLMLTVARERISIPTKDNKIELCINEHSSINYNLKKCYDKTKPIIINIKKICIDDNSLQTLETYRKEKITKLNIYEYIIFKEFYKNDNKLTFDLILHPIAIPYYYENASLHEEKYILYHPGNMYLRSPKTIFSNLPNWERLFCLDNNINSLMTKPFTIFFSNKTLNVYEWNTMLDLIEFLFRPNKTKSLLKFKHNNNTKTTIYDEDFNIHLKMKDKSMIVATLFDKVLVRSHMSSVSRLLPTTITPKLYLKVGENTISHDHTKKIIVINNNEQNNVNFRQEKNKIQIVDDPKALTILDTYITKYKLCLCTI